MSMTEQELIVSSRAIAAGLLELAKGKGASGDDITALCTNALIEILGQKLGTEFALVERLRDLADIIEIQAMGENGGQRI